MTIDTIEKEEFTLYDLRGGWALEKDKKIILIQLNKKLRSLLSQAREEEKLRIIKIIKDEPAGGMCMDMCGGAKTLQEILLSTLASEEKI